GLGVGYLKGGKDERRQTQVEQAVAIEQAVAEERRLHAIANGWTSDYINRLQRQKEKADALPKITLADNCAVPAAVGGVLLSAQGMHPDAGTGSSAGPAAAPVDST